MSEPPSTSQAHHALILGRYRIIRPLAQGGMGAVDLARTEGAKGFQRPVIIKRVLDTRDSGGEALDRFAREARITAELRHPAIVSVLEFARDGDQHLMVLEYVHGYDLGRWLKFTTATGRHIPPEMAAYVIIRVLEALDYAHGRTAPDGTARPVIHRDISPGNIMIDDEGHVKLTDFGIAMVDDLTAQPQQTGADDGQADAPLPAGTTVRGKLHYLAPDVLQGARPSAASDVYSCAVVLHELLAEQNEFRKNSSTATVYASLTHTPSRLDQLRSDVSRDAGELVARALAKEPAQRFASAHAFGEALRAAFDLDLRDAEREFARRIRADFADPRFGPTTNSPSLDEIDRAWREAPAVDDADAGRRKALSGSIALDGEEAPARKRADRWWSAAALVLGVTGLGLLALQLRPRETQRISYVDIQQHGDQPAPAAPAAPALAAAEAPRDARDAPGAADAGPRPADAGRRSQKKLADGDRSQLLTRRFARQRRRIETCFERHARVAEGAPLMAVDFEIDTRGRVVRAQLVPRDVEETDLGRCLLEVARAARFGRQPAPVGFQIPLTAHRRR